MGIEHIAWKTNKVPDGLSTSTIMGVTTRAAKGEEQRRKKQLHASEAPDVENGNNSVTQELGREREGA